MLRQTPCKGEIRTASAFQLSYFTLFCANEGFSRNEMTSQKQRAKTTKNILKESMVSFCWSNGCSVSCLGITANLLMKSPPNRRFLMLLLWCSAISPLREHIIFCACLRQSCGVIPIGQESSSQSLGQRRNEQCKLMCLLLNRMDVMKGSIFRAQWKTLRANIYHNQSQLLSKFDPECWTQDTNQSCHWF